MSSDLNVFARDLLRDAIDEQEIKSRDELEDSLHEIVDGKVPIYYSGQLEFLNKYFNDVFHADVSDVHGGGEVSVANVLPLAIFEAIREACYEVMDEFFQEDEEDGEDDEWEDDDEDDEEEED